VDRDGKTVFEFKGTQSEVNTVQPLGDGKVLLTEAGNKPRILEVDRTGRVVAEVPLQAQTKDHHLQTRMTRKLASGNYLVPQLLDRVVREYDPKGKVVWEAKTPHMPFTAIRLPDGNTLIGCTLGNLVIEVDRDGKEVWRVTNDDLPGKPINDACGVQRLPNGNTVITSHHATAGQVKLLEVTRDKKAVWTYTDQRKSGIHHFQILGPELKPGKNPLR
jgi:sugar lactone lactonase YvrE